MSVHVTGIWTDAPAPPDITAIPGCSYVVVTATVNGEDARAVAAVPRALLRETTAPGQIWARATQEAFNELTRLASDERDQ